MLVCILLKLDLRSFISYSMKNLHAIELSSRPVETDFEILSLAESYSTKD